MTDRALNTNIKIILALTLTHFIGDFYNSFILPLLPLFVAKFSLTLAQTGLITGLSRFMAFVIQPPVGYLADRYRTRLFVLGGPLLVIVFISLTGVMPGYWLLVGCVCLGSIGSSMYHPTTAGMVAPYAGRHFGFSMSIFGTGGTLAFAVGPLFISWLAGTHGLGATPLAMILGLVVWVYLFKSVPVPEGSTTERRRLAETIRDIFGPAWKPLVLVWTVMVLRALVGQSFLTFLPVHYAQQGYSLISIGVIISLFTVAGAFSGLLAGHLADKLGYRPIFAVAHALSTPSLLLLLFLPPKWVYPAAFLTGFFSLATLPLAIALAQQLAPRGKALASSLMMGLAIGTGGLLTALTGKLADIFSLLPVLNLLAFIPLLTLTMIFFFPRQYQNPAVPDQQPTHE